VQLADFLREELHRFLHVARQTENEEVSQVAAEQLWAAVCRVEQFAYAPGEDQWKALSEAERWGYLRLESYMGSALYELRKSQRTVWKVQDNGISKSVQNAAPMFEFCAVPALIPWLYIKGLGKGEVT
jgi:hypothetical protein